MGPDGKKTSNPEAKNAQPEKRLRVVLGRIAKLAAPDKGYLACAFTFLILASLAELGIPYVVSRCLVTASEVRATTYYPILLSILDTDEKTGTGVCIARGRR